MLFLDKHWASYIETYSSLETSQVDIQRKTENSLDSSQTYSLCHLWACQSQHLLTVHECEAPFHILYPIRLSSLSSVYT